MCGSSWVVFVLGSGVLLCEDIFASCSSSLRLARRLCLPVLANVFFIQISSWGWKIINISFPLTILISQLLSQIFFLSRFAPKFTCFNFSQLSLFRHSLKYWLFPKPTLNSLNFFFKFKLIVHKIKKYKFVLCHMKVCHGSIVIRGVYFFHCCQTVFYCQTVFFLKCT